MIWCELSECHKTTIPDESDFLVRAVRMHACDGCAAIVKVSKFFRACAFFFHGGNVIGAYGGNVNWFIADGNVISQDAVFEELACQEDVIWVSQLIVQGLQEFSIDVKPFGKTIDVGILIVRVELETRFIGDAARKLKSIIKTGVYSIT